MSGKFITFEGGDGAGKTTQIEKLARFLKQQGLGVIVTREPGGTPEAEKIRDLLVKTDGGDWSPEAEVLLLFAARHMHVETRIKPALARGQWVLCDRFTDSTRAYQSYGHGLPLEKIEQINNAILNGFEPDMTFLLDIDPKTGIQRSLEHNQKTASDEDRFEQKDINFHERLRQGYLEIAQMNPRRFHVLDATQELDILSMHIRNNVRNLF